MSELWSVLPWTSAAVGGSVLLLWAVSLVLEDVSIVDIFWFEAVGDAQLRRFKNNPENAGRIMDRGLWRYTRHPNYFWDALLWWGFYLMVVPLPGGWWFGLSPLVMTIFLLRISGLVLLEKHLLRRRPGYEEYIRMTSPFLPWPPSSSSNRRDR